MRSFSTYDLVNRRRRLKKLREVEKIMRVNRSEIPLGTRKVLKAEIIVRKIIKTPSKVINAFKATSSIAREGSLRH